MNTAAKCECCVCEPVCKYKDTYLAGIEAIMGAQIQLGEAENGFTFWEVKNCPHIEVSIKCPHMVAKAQVREREAKASSLPKAVEVHRKAAESPSALPAPFCYRTR